MTDLEKMIEYDIQMYIDYRDKTSLEFLLKYEYNFKDEVIKDYKVYMKDNEDEDPEDLLNYDDWIREYEEEITDELTERVNAMFNYYDFEQYEGKYGYIGDIKTAGGGPNISLRVESKYKLVIIKGYWGTEQYEKNISYLYDTIVGIYNLPNN